MNEIVTFRYGPTNLDIRTVNLCDDIWFIAADVCRGLEYDHTPHALRLLDNDEKGVHKVDTLGGPQDLVIISEPGLYKLIARSHKPAAKAFDRWVRHDVLPTLRKTGAYVMPGGPSPFDEEALLTRVGGIVKAIVHKELEQRVPQEVERRMAAERVQLLADCRHIAVSDKSALEYAKEYGAAQKGRRGLVLQLGNALRKICNQQGIPIKQCSRSGVDIFPIEIGDKFMRERGAAIVKDHNDWAFGQNVFKFPPRKRK